MWGFSPMAKISLSIHIDSFVCVMINKEYMSDRYVFYRQRQTFEREGRKATGLRLMKL